MESEDVYEDFSSSNKEISNFSNYSSKSKYYDVSNKLAIEKMKDEIEVFGLKNSLDWCQKYIRS